jgi:hypothetical protein
MEDDSIFLIGRKENQKGRLVDILSSIRILFAMKERNESEKEYIKDGGCHEYP